VYFTARDDAYGRELWKTDGTPDGTSMVKDVRPGPKSSRIDELTEAFGTVFFVADDGVHGRELWTTDGTPLGTVMVEDIIPGSDGSYPYHLTASDGGLFFIARSAASPDDIVLWRSDASGTKVVKDLMPQGQYSFVDRMLDVSGTLFLGAQEPGGLGALWRSDGTTNGTVILHEFAQVREESYPSLVGSLGGALLFVGDDATYGGELFRSDGSASGTTVVRDINPGQAGSMPAGSGSGTGGGTSYLNGLLLGERVFFDACNPDLGCEMWVSDGTTAGTMPVKDINPGAGSGTRPSGFYRSFPQMEGVDNDLYFFASDRLHSWGVWRSDGTDTGTVKLKNVLPALKHPLSYARLSAAGGTGFLWISSRHDSRFQLWKSDATATGMAFVTTIPHFVCEWDGFAIDHDLLFGVDDGKDCVLWETDGTTVGTHELKGIYPKIDREWFTHVGTTLFFDAADGSHGVELWRTDGSRDGTTLIADIAPGAASSTPRSVLFVAA